MENLIEKLRNAADSNGQLQPLQADPVLAEIAELNDPACIGPLLEFFRDDAEFDEANFALMHLIESFDDEIHVRRVAEGLPALWARSPRWAEILHVRILNSPATLSVYEEALEGFTTKQKAAARALLGALAASKPAFAERCERLLNAP